MSKDFSAEDIELRVKILVGKKKELTEDRRNALIVKFENISEYMKSIKDTFSKDYNRRDNRKGYCLE